MKALNNAHVPTDALRQRVQEQASAGWTVGHIADDLGVAPVTVEAHYALELEAGWEHLTSLAFSALKRNMLQRENLYASNTAAQLLIDRLGVVRKLRRIEHRLREMGIEGAKVVETLEHIPSPADAKPDEAKVADIRQGIRQRAASAAAAAKGTA